MVIKPVPANSTAVGNPARIIDKSKPKTDAVDKAAEAAKKQEELAEKDPRMMVRMAAYGVVANEVDPYQKRLDELEQKLAEQAEKIRALEGDKSQN